MSFKQHLQTLGQAIDDHLGEPATWSGVTGVVQVHDERADDTARFGATEVVLDSRVIRVRQALVPAPTHGDEIFLIDGQELLTVSGDPMLDADGFWTCTV